MTSTQFNCQIKIKQITKLGFMHAVSRVYLKRVTHNHQTSMTRDATVGI